MGEVIANVAVCLRHGNPREVVEVQSLPIPTPRPGFVRVRMLAAPINPSDILFCKGSYAIGPQLPAPVGLEGVGIVEESGGGWLGRFHRGKRVAVSSRSAGTWGSWCITEAQSVVPVPSSLSDEQAATFFINPASALLMTRWVFKIPQQGWLLQSAAASAVGRMIIRLGKHFGFRTLNVVRREEQVDELQKVGADAVIVADESTITDEFAEKVRSICNGDLPRFAVDPVGGHIGGLLFSSLGNGGRLLEYASLANAPTPVHPREMIVHDRHVSSFWLPRAVDALSLPQKLRFVSELSRLHKRGLFDVETFETYPLSNLREALEANESKTGGTKILLRLDEKSTQRETTS